MKTSTILLLITTVYAQAQNVDSVMNAQLKVNRFVSQRRDGKILQLLGGIGLGASVVTLTNKQQPKPWLPIVATGVFSIGVIIDISAGNHLRTRQRWRK